MTASDIAPRFFSVADRQVFGLYHAPLGSVILDAGVVICYAGPQEYHQLHWGAHKLAVMLARAGLHVLRFDYSGTGDSSGATSETSLAQWREDVQAAVDELKSLAGIRRVSLVGMRLGATLALRVTTTGVRVRDMVLWDPVVSGADYVQSLEMLETRRLADLKYPQSNQRFDNELMGYPFTAVQRAETLQIDLLTEDVGRIDRALVVSAALTPDLTALADRLVSLGVVVTRASVPDPSLLTTESHPTEAVLSHNIPTAIVRYLTGGGA